MKYRTIWHWKDGTHSIGEWDSIRVVTFIRHSLASYAERVDLYKSWDDENWHRIKFSFSPRLLFK